MAANPATAHVVGNAFVNQYYNVLHTSPQVVHRFYTDLSRLTRAEAGPDGHVETVMTQNDIFNKVMSLDYTDFKAEIKTVDSQDSLNGGVLVMVTGSLSNKTSKKRNFVQIFFLAPQEKGYFVLNDVFRYLDDDVPPPLNTPYVLENGIQERVPVSEPVEASVTGEQEVTEHPSPVASEEEVPEEAYDIHDQAEISEPEEEQTPQESAPPEMPPPVQETALPAYEPATSTLEEAQGEQPKKSYASILRKVSPVQPHLVTPKPAVAKPSPAPIVDRSTASPPVALSAAIAPQVPEGFDESIPAESEGNGRSIYIKNLPMNITEAQLETEFARFGTIKPNAIQVRTFKQQGYCYAFVEFEDPQSALNAVEANTIAIGGRQASIESKKPSSSGPRGGQGGRGQAGRGAFRGDSRGGRGGYYGGRGQGRGSGQDRGGRGFTGPRGGYSGYSNAGDDGYRRYDSQSGNGPRQQKRGGAQTPRNGSNPQGSTSE